MKVTVDREAKKSRTVTEDATLLDKVVDKLVDNQNFLLIFANKVIETFFDSSGAGVQPSLVESSGSNNLTIMWVNFDFETSDWWEVLREVGLETLPSFFCKLPRLEYGL